MSQEIDSKQRFLLDLEFINALASPQYLQRALSPLCSEVAEHVDASTSPTSLSRSLLVAISC